MGIFQQFPYSNFHEMNLDQIIKIMREMQDEWAATKSEWTSYKDFIDNYFANLDVSQEVLQALRNMAATGELNQIIDPVIANETAEWLTEHVTPTTPIVDDSLTIEGAAADAKKVGDNFNKSVIFRRYLTASDDCLALPMGVYGITANTPPANLPADYDPTITGYIIVLESQNNVVHVALCIEAYNRKTWEYTGYGWNEIPNTDKTSSMISVALDNLYNNFLPDFAEVAAITKTPGSALANTVTQFKFLDNNGIHDVSTSFPDWYVTNEITIEPWSFYYITASARSTNHYLYAVYDADGNVLSYQAASDWPIERVTNKLIYTDGNAAKIILASVDGALYPQIKNAEDTTIYAKWAGLKWACMGDSLTAVNETASIKYHDLIGGYTGINVVNLGAGGTGYKKSYDGVNGFVDRTDTIPLDSDVVTIFGSGNDNTYTIGDPSDTGTTTLCGCINTTIERIFTRIPTCKLGIITPTPWQTYNPANDTNWMAQYSAAIVEICKRWGVPCLDLYHCSNLRPWDAACRTAAFSNADGVHPNNTGHAIFAPAIEAFLDSLLMH